MQGFLLYAAHNWMNQIYSIARAGNEAVFVFSFKFLSRSWWNNNNLIKCPICYCSMYAKGPRGTYRRGGLEAVNLRSMVGEMGGRAHVHHMSLPQTVKTLSPKYWCHMVLEKTELESVHKHIFFSLGIGICPTLESFCQSCSVWFIIWPLSDLLITC